MRFLLAVATFVCLVGCGSPRQLNPGAAAAVQIASGPWMAAQYAAANGQRVNPDALMGLQDGLTGAITLRSTLHPDYRIAIAMHELTEAMEREFGPDVWKVTNRYSTPAFPCGEDGLHGYHPQAER